MSETAKETISYEKRSDVPKEYTWAVTDLYATDEDWKKDHLKIKERIPQLENYQGKLGEGAEGCLLFSACKTIFLYCLTNLQAMQR